VGDLILICWQCRRRRVPKVRHCYAIPTCYACLPPPPPLKVVKVTPEGRWIEEP